MINKEDFDRIRDTGLLISENEPFATVTPIGLLRRNRIISALSDAMIVATSSGAGGTMTQLDHAYDQRIPLFSPPSSFNFSPSEGLEMKRNDYSIKELESLAPVLEIVKQKKPSFFSSQLALLN